MNELPPDLRNGLAQVAEATRVSKTQPPSHRRDDLRHVEDAKKPETQSKRIGGTMERPTAPGGA
jgi:uncharacterized protein YdeI (YjbR/CyaY-like superfamily)